MHRATKRQRILAREGVGRNSPVQSKDWILHFRSISRVIWDGGVAYHLLRWSLVAAMKGLHTADALCIMFRNARQIYCWSCSSHGRTACSLSAVSLLPALCSLVACPLLLRPFHNPTQMTASYAYTWLRHLFDNCGLLRWTKKKTARHISACSSLSCIVLFAYLVPMFL